MRELKEISEQERKAVLEEVGMGKIKHAAKNFLISDSITLLVKWAEAETWVRAEARDLGVSAESLRTIFLGYLKDCARLVIEEYH